MGRNMLWPICLTSARRQVPVLTEFSCTFAANSSVPWFLQYQLDPAEMDKVASGQQQTCRKWRCDVLSDGSSDESDSD